MKWRLLIFPILMTLLTVTRGAEPGKVDFSFQVQPLLSDRCYFCHGPDAKKQKADLRLDTKAGAFAPRKDGKVIIKPGDPAGSELVRRILSTDPDEVMPPPEANLALTAEEKQVLRQWVEQGAEYKGHWAFQPVTSPPLPEVKEAGWAKNEIDRFVLARLEAAGLPHAKEAEKTRLLRRVTFDLTGLPPTLEELDQFLADPAPDAYEKAVDRLLATTAYGERMAVDWLDVARFADTFGYQSDVTMHVSPYRDFVIKAFNENLPFDQFITWNLAGDLLEKPTREQVVATAFNRLHRQTNEGGSINEEYRCEYVQDRVQTFGLAFMGMTVECSKCHDHKYDPISQKDYYSLTAFFQNIDESGLYSHFTNATPTPTLWLTTPEQEKKLAAARAGVEAAERQLVVLRASRRGAFEEWRKTAAAPERVTGALAEYSLDEVKGDQVANAANEKEPGKVFDSARTVPGRVGQAVELTGENNLNFAPGGKLTRDDAFSFSLWMKTPDVKERAVVFHRSKAWTDAASCGYELLLEEGRLSAALVHFWPGNAMRVVAKEPLKVNEWTHVVMAYDGSSRAAGLKLYVNGAEAAVEVVRDALTKDINRGGEDRLTIGQRFRDKGFKGGVVDEFKIFDRQLTATEAGLLAGGKPAGDLYEFYLATVDADWRPALDVVKKARQARSAAGDNVPELMVMKEMPQPKKAFLLKRGQYDSPAEEVGPDTPARILPFPEGAPRNRLGLAQWVTSPQQPLTSRVVVNRFWQSIHGRGLVGTPEDFGLQGQLPTHPELLDWLARRFIDSKWDVKGLFRLMVTSAEYRQDSVAAPEVRAKDPENRLLGRAPRYRLSAEALRDQSLAAAGVLDRKIGGPSVEGGGNRRSLYTFWKRTMPPQEMEIFDAAKREVCTARRPLTATPLQALALLNNPRLQELARALVKRISAQEADPEKRLGLIFRTLTSRAATEKELDVLRRMRDEQREHLKDKGPAAEEEALVLVANAVASFDDAVMRK